jgi:glycosyltransferase involved in cell wall biosynthesis
MSKTIYLSVNGALSGGGPNIFSYKFATEMAKRGHKIIYDNPQNSDVALCIINTGKIVRKTNPNKTKVFLRIDGIYNKVYNEKFNRAVEGHMVALHNELARDIPLIHHTIFQSSWSKDRIFEEIVKIDDPSKYSIIHNGANVNIFKPIPRQNDGFINLLHIGSMRNGYFMETLIGVYEELKCRNKKIRLVLVGNMDKECLLVYNKYRGDVGIRHLGAFPNDQLTQAYAQGDIFLSARIGSSCDNTVPEAQSCGLPVICASYSGNAEMVINNETGIVVESGEWDYGNTYNNNIADAIEKIIPNLDDFKKRSREHAVKSLSIEVMINKYIKTMGL